MGNFPNMLGSTAFQGVKPLYFISRNICGAQVPAHRKTKERSWHSFPSLQATFQMMQRKFKSMPVQKAHSNVRDRLLYRGVLHMRLPPPGTFSGFYFDDGGFLARFLLFVEHLPS